MKKITIALLLLFSFGYAQTIETPEDFSVDYLANIYKGLSNQTQDEILSTPIFATIESMAAYDWAPGRSCYPSANRIVKVHEIASGTDSYAYYEINTTLHRFLGLYRNGCNSGYGFECYSEQFLFPHTVICPGNPSPNVDHCESYTTSAGVETEVVYEHNSTGSSSGWATIQFVRTVNPALILKTKLAYSGSSFSEIKLYDYQNIPWLGLKNNNTTSDYKVFPNPANTYLTISNPNFNTIESSAVVYDAYGKRITEEKLDVPEKIIDMGQYRSGLYILLIKDESNHIVHSEKILKR